MDMQKAKQVQQEVCSAAQIMAGSGLTAGTWGNVSSRIDDEYMVITPSGVDYKRIMPEQMVIVNMRTHEYLGDLKPSTEVPIHAGILLSRPEINSVVHTHSTWALTIAAAQKSIPPICADQVQILGGEVRCSRYAMPGTPEIGQYVVEALKDRRGALIANHGAITIGSSAKDALLAATVLEKSAQVAVHVQLIGGGVKIPREDQIELHDYFINRYGRE